jgi:scyllo-inositol 2-dehydrogenase (NADP+)
MLSPTPVRFGVIGTNWITGALIEAGRTVPGFEARCVLSRSVSTGRAFAEYHGLTAVHTTLESLAADESIDAVYVASPNSLHAEQARTLLAAGKHVLAEKPLGASAAQVAGLAGAAVDCRRLLMEAYMAPFEPNVAALRDALGEVGQVRRVVLAKDQYSSRYDALKAGELPNAFNPAFAAGSLMDLGIYPVALAVLLFGEPTTILATGEMLPSGVDGQGTLLLGYDGFEVACLHSKITPGGLGSEISGEDGVLTFDDCSVPTEVHLARRDGHRTDLTRPQSERHMRYEIEHFLACIRDGLIESPAWPVGPGGSLSVARILDEARRQTGVRFTSDP